MKKEIIRIKLKDNNHKASPIIKKMVQEGRTFEEIVDAMIDRGFDVSGEDIKDVISSIEDLAGYEEYLEKENQQLLEEKKQYVVYAEVKHLYGNNIYICNHKSDNKFLEKNAKVFNSLKKAEETAYWATVKGYYNWKVRPL